MNISKKRFHNEINVQLKQKESKFAIKTGKDDISLPAVIVFSGSSGSGKTYSWKHTEIIQLSLYASKTP